MPTISKLSVTLDANIAPFVKQINEAVRLAQESLNRVKVGIGSSVGRGGNVSGIAGQQAEWTRAGDSAGRAFGSALAKRLVFYLTSIELVKALGGALDNFAQFSKAEAVMGRLVGDRGQAKEFLGELRGEVTSGRAAPFGLFDLTKASQQMIVYGFTLKDTKVLLDVLTDAAAAFPEGSAEAIERVTRALGQMKAKGRVRAEEMRQLAELGIPAWENLAKVLGVDVAGAMRLVQANAVDAGTGILAVTTAIQERFGGMKKEIAQTPGGKWDRTKANIELFMMDQGSKIYKGFGLGDMMDYFNDKMGTPKSYLEKAHYKDINKDRGFFELREYRDDQLFYKKNALEKFRRGEELLFSLDENGLEKYKSMPTKQVDAIVKEMNALGPQAQMLFSMQNRGIKKNVAETTASILGSLTQKGGAGGALFGIAHNLMGLDVVKAGQSEILGGNKPEEILSGLRLASLGRNTPFNLLPINRHELLFQQASKANIPLVEAISKRYNMSTVQALAAIRSGNLSHSGLWETFRGAVADSNVATPGMRIGAMIADPKIPGKLKDMLLGGLGKLEAPFTAVFDAAAKRIQDLKDKPLTSFQELRKNLGQIDQDAMLVQAKDDPTVKMQRAKIFLDAANSMGLLNKERQVNSGIFASSDEAQRTILDAMQDRSTPAVEDLLNQMKMIDDKQLDELKRVGDQLTKVQIVGVFRP